MKEIFLQYVNLILNSYVIIIFSIVGALKFLLPQIKSLMTSWSGMIKGKNFEFSVKDFKFSVIKPDLDLPNILRQTFDTGYFRKMSSPIIENLEKAIIVELQKQPLENENDLKNIINNLIHHYAHKALENSLLIIDTYIFPSQRDLLNLINNSKSCTEEKVKELYDSMDKIADSHTKASLEYCLAFLRDYNLVWIDTTNNYRITHLGIEYLKYKVQYPL